MFQRSLPVALEQNEEVKCALRRHGIVLVGRILPPLVLLCGTPLVVILGSGILSLFAPMPRDVVIRAAAMAFGALVVPMVGWAILNSYDWWNDRFIVTTRRVIRFEQRFFTSQAIIAAGLGQIQNVAVNVPDPLANILHYGTVVIETAAQAGRIEFDMIHNPHAVQRLIFELRGVPPPPQYPRQPARKSLLALVAMLFPFIPQEMPDGSIIYHKHWFVLFQVTRGPLFLVALTLLAAWLISPWLLLPLVVLVPVIAYQYANWVNDIYILTPTHIIDIVRIPFVREDRKQALLEQVQNVQVTIPDVGSRLLDMGDVFVETAGKAENFNFRTVHHPTRIADELNRRITAVRALRRRTEEEARRHEIEEIVGQILHTQYGYPPPGQH